MSQHENAIEHEQVQTPEGGDNEQAQGHRMSIALTIGATIGAIGLVLFIYGLVGNVNYAQSANININLWWGLLMVVFGIIMSVGSFISTRRSRAV
ncbi:hypothetical protein [Dictyobacter aurantiacus]|uniref:Uncharacterized protein n=1 Tax=Dictyobacter aurantiacus TaxID=1936993 RepID=A0A401ZA76_9CHLR|nr:hypothetical protein [Dictyobacter aurantiacus]GCE03708.1 hypothetical protein KDAU_10370 [Dictyobacter aurantiacus]